MSILSGQVAYDLSYRPAIGSTTRYLVEAAYHDLDGRGLRAGSEVYSAEMQRRVVDAGPPVREEVVWSGFVHQTLDADGAVVAEAPLAWADGFAYEHRFSYAALNDGLGGFLDASAEIPRDLEGWNVFLLMVDAHVEFDMPRSAEWRIDGLRVPGDVVEPGIGEAMALDFEPFIRAEFEPGESSRSRFIGVSDSEGHASAVLESDFRERHPFTMRPGGGQTIEASTSLRRELLLRLSDGVLERGVSIEWVCVGGRWVNPIYSTELLSERPA